MLQTIPSSLLRQLLLSGLPGSELQLHTDSLWKVSTCGQEQSESVHGATSCQYLINMLTHDEKANQWHVILSGVGVRKGEKNGVAF